MVPWKRSQPVSGNLLGPLVPPAAGGNGREEGRKRVSVWPEVILALMDGGWAGTRRPGLEKLFYTVFYTVPPPRFVSSEEGEQDEATSLS